MLSFFPLDVLDEIWDVIESVSEGFLTYSCTPRSRDCKDSKMFIRLRVMLLRAIRESFLIHGFAR